MVSVWYCTVVPELVTSGPTWVCWVWLRSGGELSVPNPVMRMSALPGCGGAESWKPGPWAWVTVSPEVPFGKAPKYAQSFPTPWPPLDWSDAPSTGYWSEGGGFWMEPELDEGGTLNWITWMLPVQCPAVRKQPAQSWINQPVQPTGSSRPERASVEGSRSSLGPQMEVVPSSGGVPMSMARSCTRLVPVPGRAQTSTTSESPLKYAVERSQRSTSMAFMTWRPPSSIEVMRSSAPVPASGSPARTTSSK